jgi:hypothetical protein
MATRTLRPLVASPLRSTPLDVSSGPSRNGVSLRSSSGRYHHGRAVGAGEGEGRGARVRERRGARARARAREGAPDGAKAMRSPVERSLPSP